MSVVTNRSRLVQVALEGFSFKAGENVSEWRGFHKLALSLNKIDIANHCCSYLRESPSMSPL